jgi:predicted transcriptional regulator
LATTKDENERILSELESIKRLLMLGLTKAGVTQEQLAKALQISQPSVSRMLPPGLSAPKNPARQTRKPGRRGS